MRRLCTLTESTISLSVEVLALGYKCDLRCRGCYEQPTRSVGNALNKEYSLDAIKATLLQQNTKFTLFGGEPLLLPIEDVEELWRFGLEKWGHNGIQSNGTLWTETHVALAKKYKVGVGLSIDGPDELNDARWGGTPERTREKTARSHWTLNRLLEEGCTPSLICNLSRYNASTERLPILLKWFRELAAKGLRHVNLHLYQIDKEEIRAELELTEDENVEALLSCARMMSDTPLQFSPLTDMRSLLTLGNGAAVEQVSCVWSFCDPYTTNAVQGIGGDGALRNCGRVNTAGVNYIKPQKAGYERYLALAHTPQKFGGCQGCRFFSVCGGNCPGTSEQHDWRGRTEHCAVLMRVYERLEAAIVAEGLTPLSLSPDRPGLEAGLMSAWAHGQNPSRRNVLERLRKGEPVLMAPTPNRPHGDTPHGDHTDAERPIVRHGDSEAQWANL